MRHHPGFLLFEKAALDVKRILERLTAMVMQIADKENGIEDIPTWMGAFGGSTAKRSVLSGTNRRVLFPLFRKLSNEQRGELKAKPVVSERVVVSLELSLLQINNSETPPA